MSDRDDSVLVAYLHPNQISHSFHESLSVLTRYDLVNHGRVIRGGGPVMFRCGPNGLVEARNSVARHLLDESAADWLFLVDSDMGFAPDTVDRLLEATGDLDENGIPQRPVVGGLCFGVREVARNPLGGWRVRPFPTLYDWARDTTGTFGFQIRRKYERNTLTQVAGTGAACLLVHREVFRRIRENNGDNWFNPVQMTNGQLVGEDLSFCFRVNSAGFPLFVHTGVQTTHHKAFWVDEDMFDLIESQYTEEPS